MPAATRGAHTGLGHTCFLVLAMFAREATADEILAFLLADGVTVSRTQVKSALNNLRRSRAPLVEVARGGGKGVTCWYRLTGHGRAVHAED